jgi:hypothetical protein
MVAYVSYINIECSLVYIGSRRYANIAITYSKKFLFYCMYILLTKYVLHIRRHQYFLIIKSFNNFQSREIETLLTLLAHLYYFLTIDCLFRYLHLCVLRSYSRTKTFPLHCQSALY